MNRHFICTREEAKKLISKQTNFWVSNCECKLYNTNPNRVESMDVCLLFKETNDLGWKDLQKISKEDVLELLLVAKQSHTIMKAFRNQNLLKTIGGICFCSHECFGYFKEKNATYDKGKSIEKTDFTRCSNCGVCINICEFHARKMVDDKLKVDHTACYGCGLCADVCPMECIDMVSRKR
jgi:Pyruvate/2-oxoacid:ferredoxin oxidoreductase delta subunit